MTRRMVNECVGCESFPCLEVNRDLYQLPEIEIDTEAVRMVMISEATPQNPGDYYYTGEEALFVQTTVRPSNLLV